MQTLRTPDFQLADFEFEPRYVDVPDQDGGTLRMAYVEAGPADGPVALLLHGEPSWSYLYRNVMRTLAAAGIRAVAPDLVGFGRSDKPTEVADHSYARHVEWMRSLVFDALDLRGVTLVGQDWGGLIGLRLVAEHADRFARVVIANSGLPTGDEDMPAPWWKFHDAVAKAETLDIGRLVQAGCRTKFTPEIRAGYDAPFPDETYKRGPRAMPPLVPKRPDDPAAEANRAAWKRLRAMDIPFLCAFSDSDPITASWAPNLKNEMPGARGRNHPTITEAGHFLQEDKGPELGETIAAFIRE